MNKAVKRLYRGLNRRAFGYLLMYGLEHFSEVCEKVREVNRLRSGYPNPIPIVKYVLRQFPVWRSPCRAQRVSLAQLKEPVDPLQPVRFWCFDGRFVYDPDAEAFVPMGDYLRKTGIMRDIYSRLEARRVKRAWAQASQHLYGAEGGEPVLEYQGDQ